MALQSSGQITLSEIATEFGGSAPHALSEYYDKGNAPASGEIELATDFYGTSSFGSTASTCDVFSDSSARALYKFDNNVNDTCGSYNLGWSGTSAFDTSGILNQAASFGGSSAISNSSMQFGNDWTVSVWIKGGGTIIFNRVRGSYGHRTCEITNSRLKIYNGSTDQYMTWTAPSTSTWNHLVVTKGSGTAKAYINGSSVTSMSMNNTNTGNSGTYIGAKFDGDSGTSLHSYFSGSMDLMRIFNRALTSTEVTTLYETG
jgi:hypothetical protein